MRPLSGSPRSSGTDGSAHCPGILFRRPEFVFAEIQNPDRFPSRADLQRTFRRVQILSGSDGLNPAVAEKFDGPEHRLRSVIPDVVVGQKGDLKARRADDVDHLRSAVEIRSAFRNRCLPFRNRRLPLDDPEIRSAEKREKRTENFLSPDRLPGCLRTDVSCKNDPEESLPSPFPNRPDSVILNHGSFSSLLCHCFASLFRTLL